MEAYSVRAHQVVGPGWLDGQKYDVVAKMPTGTSKVEVRCMLQTLLAERFGLRFHRESRDLRVYALVVDEGGPKFHKAAVSEGAIAVSRGRVSGPVVSMEYLVLILSRFLDVPVLDMTSLTGKYEITVTWAPLEAALGPEGDTSDHASGPDILTAVREQLGLRVRRDKPACCRG